MKKSVLLERTILLGFVVAFGGWCITWWWILRDFRSVRIESAGDAAFLLAIGLPLVLGPLALAALFTGRCRRVALWSNTAYWLLAAGGEALEGGTMRPSPYAVIPVALLSLVSLVFLLRGPHDRSTSANVVQPVELSN